jgi:hypothetical protein
VTNDLEYHLDRARAERNTAYGAGHERVSDAHMKLSALHLQRALLLREVNSATVENPSGTFG